MYWLGQIIVYSIPFYSSTYLSLPIASNFWTDQRNWTRGAVSNEQLIADESNNNDTSSTAIPKQQIKFLKGVRSAIEATEKINALLNDRHTLQLMQLVNDTSTSINNTSNSDKDTQSESESENESSNSEEMISELKTRYENYKQEVKRYRSQFIDMAER